MKTKKGATLVGSLVAITILTTTFVSVLELQTNIIRSKLFLQYDNTANLLMAEGLEIVRSIYAKDGTVTNGKYQVDYKTSIFSNGITSSCTDSEINLSCDMDLATPGESYGYVTCRSSSDCIPRTNRIFYRFVEITNVNVSSTPPSTPKVTSTVVVRNPKGGVLRVYKATIELYKID